MGRIKKIIILIMSVLLAVGPVQPLIALASDTVGNEAEVDQEVPMSSEVIPIVEEESSEIERDVVDLEIEDGFEELESSEIVEPLEEESSEEEEEQVEDEVAERLLAKSDTENIGQSITTETELINYLESEEVVSGYLAGDVSLKVIANIKSDKHLDLQGYTITAGDGSRNNPKGQFYLQGTRITEFVIENGHLKGGDSNYLTNGATNIGLITADDETGYGLNVIVRDVTHQSAGGFFKGTTSNITFEGHVVLDNDDYNVRALNMTFKGVFEGTVSTDGSPGMYATGKGALNLSFNYTNSYNGKTNRVVTIERGAKVSLTNLNKSAPFGNNIANFGEINIDGELDAKATAPNIRTIVEDPNRGDESRININPGSKVSLHSNSDKGVIYTYHIRVTVDSPDKLNFINDAQHLFTIGISGKATHYLFKNTSIGGFVSGNQASQLADWGNINVDSLEITGIGSTEKTSEVAINGHEITGVNINDYSKLSNDFVLIDILPDDATFFDKRMGQHILQNYQSSLFGTVMFRGTGVEDERQTNGTIRLKIGRDRVPRVVDLNAQGEWRFDSIDLGQYKVGDAVTLEYLDGLGGKPIVKVLKLVDRTPPKATPKLIKVAPGDRLATRTFDNYLETYSDETTTLKSKLQFEHLLTQGEINRIFNTPGFHKVLGKVSDEAGNETMVEVPVIVTRTLKELGTDLVSAENFSYDYSEWMKADLKERKKIILKNARVKAYVIKNQNVLEESGDYSSIGISIDEKKWEKDDVVDVLLKTKGFEQTIQITLIDTTVLMTVKYLLGGTNEAIIEDLEANIPIKEKQIPVEMGKPLDDMIQESDLKVTYEGYESPEMMQYEVVGYTEPPKFVPPEDFTLIYRYKGTISLQTTDLTFNDVVLTPDINRLFAPTTETTPVIFVNTIKKAGTSVSLAISKELTLEDGRTFNGDLLYYNQEGISKVINRAPSPLIEFKGGDIPPMTILDSKGSSDRMGFKLRQSSGNYIGDYQGELLWTISDTPKS